MIEAVCEQDYLKTKNSVSILWMPFGIGGSVVHTYAL